MPEHKKGESKKSWMKRCVPYVIKKEGLSQKEANGKCNGMYDSWKKKQKKMDGTMDDEYEEGKSYEFRFDSFSGDGEPTEFDFVEFVEKATSKKGFNMVIAKGNMFMKGIYISKDEMKAAHTRFNNTMHDLNHMGSGYMAGFSIVPPDISYIVGWQDSLSYDDETNEVRANVHIEKGAVRYDDWKTYIDISAKIGRNPNVSMYVFAQLEFIEARKLPKDSRYGANGYKADDLVPCMVNIQPFMVSTVTKGACDDKRGCGIKQSCEDGTCESNNEENSEISVEVKVVDLEKSIKENDKKIKLLKRIKNIRGE